MIKEDPTFFQYVLFYEMTKPHFITMDNSTGITVIIGLHTILIGRVDNQHRWSLNIWCGIVNEYLIGLYFFDIRLNGENYLFFLQNILSELLEEIDLVTRQKKCGGSKMMCYLILIVLWEYLDNIFHERWIERYGYIRWPPTIS